MKKVGRAARKLFVSRLVVRGRGSFPLDMLRYDRCLPYSEVDSGKMERTSEEREVTLLRYSGDPGSGAMAPRWASFGWYVVSEEELNA